MLHSLIDACFRQRWLVMAALVAVTALGLYVAFTLSVDAFPDLTNNQITVITEAGPLSPTEVESQVTYPIETALMGIPKTMQLRSVSKLGLSIVTVVLDDSVNLYFGRQLVNERLREVRGRLPQGIEPTLGPVATAFGELYQYTIDNPNVTLLDRKTLQDWIVRPQLRTVPGISEVNGWGGFTRQITVEVDPAALLRYNLSARDVVEHLQASNENFGGGFVNQNAEQFTVLGTGRFRSLDDIGQVVLSERNGVPVLVRDVAQFHVEGMLRQGAVLRDGQGESVCGMAIMLKGENSRAVIDRVKARLASLRLPPGTSVTAFYDQSEVINITVDTVRRNLIEAGLLVVTVLMLFLGNVRAALIVAAVIPFSMLFGFMGMAFFGVSANLMSLGAIDFGMMADGAVVMMENSLRRLHGRPGEPDVLRESAREMARPILFGVLIIIAVYLPVFFLEDLEGRMFRPMAITVCASLLGSLALALTAVPVAASYLFKGDVKEKTYAWYEWLAARYRAIITAVLRHPFWPIAFALVLLAVALGSVPYLGTEFMPRLDEGAIIIQTKALPGINLPSSVAASARVQEIVMRFPEVGHVVTKLGRPDVATEAMGVYEADVYVVLKPESRWMNAEQKANLIARMDTALQAMPGMEFNFTMPMAMRLDETVSGVKADVAIKIFGEDSAKLTALADRIKAAVAPVAGVADLQMELSEGVGELRVEPQRERLARYGLTIQDLRDAVDSTTGGMRVADFVEGQRRYPLMLRFPSNYRADLERMRNLVLRAPAGEQVRLSQVATVERHQGPEIIQRENGQKRLVVQFNVRGRDLGSVVGEAQARIQRTVTLPTGYWLDWGGQFENQQRAMRRLSIILPISITLILALLYATFTSLRQSLLILCAVPFALIGGVAMLWVRGMNLNLSAAVGFIALFGVAVLNGVVMVSTMNHLRQTGLGLHEAVVEGAVERLRPVLITALVAVVGFLPMTLSSAPGSEIQRPLATVVVGGLLSATVLTLFLLPVLYRSVVGFRK
ncbi:MAG: CusA/CzcA family heavy metal efflux RND transporter [Bryobacteraceae bacterium]|nr:CusA/CzcA family heavy metal efflux RND transporter [Bryobacteraceae bacterium]